jgi:hypothetical protein
MSSSTVRPSAFSRRARSSAGGDLGGLFDDDARGAEPLRDLGVVAGHVGHDPCLVF